MQRPDGISAIELAHVVHDLQTLVGAHVHDVWVPTSSSIILGIGREQWLAETWPLPRLHPIVKRPRNPSTPFSFQGLLRARFRGPVLRVEQRHDDRVVEIDVEGWTLHLRLFGRGGGAWLIREGRVVASLDGPAPTELPSLPPRETKPTRAPRFTPQADERWSDAAARWLGSRAQEAARAELRRLVSSGLRTQAARARRLVGRLEEDLARAEGADTLQEDADCLAAALHTVPRGAASAVVPDLFHDGVMRSIALDPSKPVAANLQRLYEKAARLGRAQDRILERLVAASARAEALARAAADAADADIADVRALAEQWSISLHPSPRDAPTRASVPWDAWSGPDGAELLVGRNAASNHRLTFRRARGRDWWLHVRDRPGAHVVMPRPDGASPPLELLLAAAELALRDAGVPEGEHADVQYARVADLRAVPGEPGRVLVTREHVLHVRRNPAHLSGWHRGGAS